MTVPDIVQERLGDEEVGGRIPLGGESELLVTRTRTLVYRAEGLLSGESVEEYPHDAERIEVASGRRKSKINLDYGIDGGETISVPTDRLSDALRAVFAGVLFAAGVIQPGETVERLYRRGELTYAITSARIIKHVGSDVWNGEEYEEFHFDDVTGLDVERGEVNSQLILEVDGRPQRIKSPTEDIREIRVNTERALLAHRDMDSMEEFNRAIEAEREASTDPGEEPTESSASEPASVFDSELDLIGATAESMSSDAGEAGDPSQESGTGGGVAEAEAGSGALQDVPDETAAASSGEPGPATLSTDPASDPGGGPDADSGLETADAAQAVETNVESQTEAEAEAEAGADADPVAAGIEADDAGAEFEDAGFEPAAANHSADVAAELAELRRAVDRQAALLEDHQQTLERLIEELRRGR